MKREKKHIKPFGESVKPTTFAVGGKVFDIADFSGVQAQTIKDRLEKHGVTISMQLAERLYESINGKKKGE